MQTMDARNARLLVAPDELLAALDQECLLDYIKSGGSSVKVVSGSDANLGQVRERLRERARQENYYYAALDPARLDAGGKKKDLHRIDRFFFETTANVDWKAWAREQARRFLDERGIYVAAHRSLDDLDGIAHDNDRSPQDLLNQYQREFSTTQLRDNGMAIEFRAAITALGRAQLVPDAVSPTTEEVMLKWFAGRTLPGAASTLKRVQIFERIGLANARAMLVSFCRWLPRTGHDGLVAVLDFRAYEHKKIPATQRLTEQLRRIDDALARGASASELTALRAEVSGEPTTTYTDAAYMQMLALIRRFIDEIDSFERFLLVILTTPAFYDETSRRNYTNYDALQTRIGLEVRDARYANPAAALVHVGQPNTVMGQTPNLAGVSNTDVFNPAINGFSSDNANGGEMYTGRDTSHNPRPPSQGDYETGGYGTGNHGTGNYGAGNTGTGGAR